MLQKNLILEEISSKKEIYSSFFNKKFKDPSVEKQFINFENQNFKKTSTIVGVLTIIFYIISTIFLYFMTSLKLVFYPTSVFLIIDIALLYFYHKTFNNNYDETHTRIKILKYLCLLVATIVFFLLLIFYVRYEKRATLMVFFILSNMVILWNYIFIVRFNSIFLCSIIYIFYLVSFIIASLTNYKVSFNVFGSLKFEMEIECNSLVNYESLFAKGKQLDSDYIKSNTIDNFIKDVAESEHSNSSSYNYTYSELIELNDTLYNMSLDEVESYLNVSHIEFFDNFISENTTDNIYSCYNYYHYQELKFIFEYYQTLNNFEISIHKVNSFIHYISEFFFCILCSYLSYIINFFNAYKQEVFVKVKENEIMMNYFEQMINNMQSQVVSFGGEKCIFYNKSFLNNINSNKNNINNQYNTNNRLLKENYGNNIENINTENKRLTSNYLTSNNIRTVNKFELSNNDITIEDLKDNSRLKILNNNNSNNKINIITNNNINYLHNKNNNRITKNIDANNNINTLSKNLRLSNNMFSNATQNMTNNLSTIALTNSNTKTNIMRTEKTKTSRRCSIKRTITNPFSMTNDITSIKDYLKQFMLEKPSSQILEFICKIDSKYFSYKSLINSNTSSININKINLYEIINMIYDYDKDHKIFPRSKKISNLFHSSTIDNINNQSNSEGNFDNDQRYANFQILGTFSFKTKDHKIFLRKFSYKEDKFITDIMIDDVTEIKSAERMSFETKLKQKLFSKMAHEFKTPLLVIKSLISDLNDPDNEDIVNTSAYIYYISDYITFLINDIIYYTNNQDVKVQMEEVDILELMEFCEGVTRSLIAVMPGNKQHVHVLTDFKVESLKYFSVVSDKTKLKQILLNLISNAVKFTKNGNIYLKIEINETDITKPEIKLIVKDEGIGIKKSELEKIRSENPNSTGNSLSINTDFAYNQMGTGLGLLITKTLAKAMNHEFSVNSIEGKGSEFSINIKSVTKKTIIDENNSNGLTSFHNESSIYDYDNYNNNKEERKKNSKTSFNHIDEMKKNSVQSYNDSINHYYSKIHSDNDNENNKHILHEEIREISCNNTNTTRYNYSNSKKYYNSKDRVSEFNLNLNTMNNSISNDSISPSPIKKNKNDHDFACHNQISEHMNSERSDRISSFTKVDNTNEDPLIVVSEMDLSKTQKILDTINSINTNTEFDADKTKLFRINQNNIIQNFNVLVNSSNKSKKNKMFLNINNIKNQNSIININSHSNKQINTNTDNKSITNNNNNNSVKKLFKKYTTMNMNSNKIISNSSYMNSSNFNNNNINNITKSSNNSNINKGRKNNFYNKFVKSNTINNNLVFNNIKKQVKMNFLSKDKLHEVSVNSMNLNNYDNKPKKYSLKQRESPLKSPFKLPFPSPFMSPKKYPILV